MQRIGKYCNCKNPECTSPGNNYECCSENVPNGGTARYGLWIESNYCDKTKGLPIGAENNESYQVPMNKNTGNIENYRRSYRQPDEEQQYDEEDDEEDESSDDDECSDWRNAFYSLLFILIIVAVVLCTVIYLKSKSNI